MNGTYIVNATVNGQHETRTLDVRTAHEAGVLTRRALNASTSVSTFRIDLIREVRMVWNPDTGRYDCPMVVLTDSWAHSLPEVMHR